MLSSQLDELRSRAVSVVTATGLGAAIVGGIGVDSASAWSVDLFIAGAIAFLVTLWFAGDILRPHKDWPFGFSVQMVLEDKLGGLYGGVSNDDFYLALASSLTEDVSSFQKKLDKLLHRLWNEMVVAAIAVALLFIAVVVGLID